MINLIPNKEKKEMVKGFYYRLIVLFLAVGSVSFLIVLVAILPSYFLSSEKNSVANAKLEMQKNEPAPLPQEQTLTIIKNINNKLALIEKTEENKFIVSQKVINAIILKKIPGVEITDISYENIPAKGSGNDGQMAKKISIQGNALSREVLLLFRQALEDGITFKQVDLPISNFVKGSNIQFYLSLIPE
jgi:hypothetical protein